jgi:hypothetical protein
MSTAVASSPRPPSSRDGRLPHRPAPPVTSRRLGALGNSEDVAQTAKNNAVAGKMVELGDALVSLHDSALINIKAKIAQLAARLKESFIAANDCEDSYVWAQPCNWDFEMLCKAFGYKLTVAEMADLLALGEYNPAEPRFALQELATTLLNKRKLSAKKDELKDTDRHSHLEVTDAVIALYEFLHADVLGHAKEELSRTDAGIARVLKTIEHLQTMKEEAIRETNIAAAEQHHHGMVDAYIELLEILNARLGQLAHSGNDTSSFRGQAQRAIDEADQVVAAFTHKSASLQTVLNDDLANAEEVRRQEQQKHKDATAAHRQYVRTFHDELKANAEQQQQSYDRIQAIIEDMRVLAEDRLRLLRLASEEKATEELRAANYNEFC